MPSSLPASTLLVESKPAIQAARAAFMPASVPWLRRSPNSASGRPLAASTERTALLAISVGRWIRLITAVSTSCASISGAVISSSGSSAKTTVPSGIARTWPVKRRLPRWWRNGPSTRPSEASHSSAPGVKRRARRYWRTSSRPAASRNPRSGGSRRTNRLNVAVARTPARKQAAAIVSSYRSVNSAASCSTCGPEANPPAGGGVMPKATLTFAMRLLRVALPLALLSLIALTRVALTWRVYTPTFDEPAHIAAGMEWLDRGVYRYEEMHPPLARVADALGPRLGGLHSEGQTGIWREGNAILTQRADQARALALARAGSLPFLLLAILVVFAWARSLAGDSAGLLAVLAFTSVPPVLAHAGLATTDAAAMGTIALAVYSLLRWLERPGLPSTLKLGLAVGLALLAQMSDVLFLPAAFVVALLVWRSAGNRLSSHVGGALVPGRVALLVIWAGYRFSVGPINERTADSAVAAAPAALARDRPDGLKRRVASLLRLPLFPAPEYFRGVRDLRAENRIGERKNYLLGEPILEGRWAFFPVALGVKTPIPFLVLALVGTVALGVAPPGAGGGRRPPPPP